MIGKIMILSAFVVLGFVDCCLMAVSYTHLDVYKRQEEGLEALLLELRNKKKKEAIMKKLRK